MFKPTPTRQRRPTLEQETAWANQVSQMQENPPQDQFDPEPPGALLPPFLGKPRKQPDRKLTPQEQRDLDAEAMRIRCLGKTYRQIAFHLDISTSTAYARVKRHLYHQRKYLHENAADIRDFQLHALEQMLPHQIHNAIHGDKRAFTLVLQGFKHQQKLSMIPNPTVKDELKRMVSSGDDELARCYDPGVFEEDNVGWVLAPTEAEPGVPTESQAPTEDGVGRRTDGVGRRTDGVGASTHPTTTTTTWTRRVAEHLPEQRSQGVANPAVAPGATFSTQQTPGLGSAINVVLVLILLAVQVGLACRAWPGYTSSREIQNQDQGTVSLVSPASEHEQPTKRHRHETPAFTSSSRWLVYPGAFPGAPGLAAGRRSLLLAASSRLSSSSASGAGLGALKSHDFSYGNSFLQPTASSLQPKFRAHCPTLEQA